MKAFVSYIVSDNNEYILTLLSLKLRENGFVVNTSQNFYNNILDYNTMNEINESHLFISIITSGGSERKRVIQEWEYAASRNIPNILLIEDNVSVNQDFTGNYIRFNRRNPQPAIQEINKRMSQNQQLTPTKTNDIVPWILGGTALLAILTLFSSEKK